MDGPAYTDVTGLRVFVEDGDLVVLFRVDSGPSDLPPSPDVAYSLFIDKNGDGKEDVRLRVFAHRDEWAAVLHRFDRSVDSRPPAEDLRPVVNEYGVGTRVDLALIARGGDLRFVGQTADNEVFDNVPDDLDAWVSLQVES